MLTRALTLSVITLSAASFTTHANETIPLSNTSLHEKTENYFYLGGRIGWANFEDSCFSHALDCGDDTFGYGGYGGYQFTNWFSLELGVTDYGDPDAKYTTGKVETDNIGFEATAKFDYNLTQKLELYTRLGASYLDIDKTVHLSDGGSKRSNSNDWRPLVAIGMEYPLSESVYLRGEYQFIDGIGDSSTDKADLHYTSVGITYRFGNNQAPAPVPVVEPIAEPVILTTVNLSGETLFVSDSAELTVSPKLNELASALVAVEHDELTQTTTNPVIVQGHADSTGSEKYNLTISERRAQSVADYLVEKGVASERIYTEGFGESQPIAPNNTPEGRAKNRRVEIKFEANQIKNKDTSQ